MRAFSVECRRVFVDDPGSVMAEKMEVELMGCFEIGEGFVVGWWYGWIRGGYVRAVSCVW